MSNEEYGAAAVVGSSPRTGPGRGTTIAILVTGAGGMLGRAVVAESRRRGHETISLGRPDLDVTEFTAVADAVTAAGAKAVIHCAAYTDVERAESERDAAFAVNERGAENVARACARSGAWCVYVSTDYVFDGERDGAYGPGDEPRPLNVYGESKLAGEAAVGAVDGDWLIVRTSLLYGSGGRNFVDRMLELARTRERLRVVSDQHSRPTWTGTLAPALLDLVDRRARGIHHVADDGAVSRYELTVAALELAGLETPVTAVPSSYFPTAATRPRNSVLDTTGTEAVLGRRFTPWRDALATHLSTPTGGMD